MTQPQTQPFTPGQVVDFSRSQMRQRTYPGVLRTWTATVAGAVATGAWSYDINDTTVTYNATVAPDTIAIIAQGLQTFHIGSPEAFRLANATVAAGVITIQSRSVDDPVWSLSNPVDFTGTLTLADITAATTDLELGVAVALIDSNTIRHLAPGDTAASAIFGISAEMPASALKMNSGSPADFDVYEVGAQVDILTKGEIPVLVEMAIAIGDPVFVRHTATGTEVFGAFRNLADGGDTVQLTDARWTEPSWTDSQGRLVAMLNINIP